MSLVWSLLFILDRHTSSSTLRAIKDKTTYYIFCVMSNSNDPDKNSFEKIMGKGELVKNGVISC